MQSKITGGATTLLFTTKVLDKYGALGVVELTALVGYYTMVAMTLNAHEFSLPEGASNPFADPASTE